MNNPKKKIGQSLEKEQGGVKMEDILQVYESDVKEEVSDIQTQINDEKIVKELEERNKVIKKAEANIKKFGLKDKIKNFPQELLEQTRWCNYKLPKKIPMDSKHGGSADASDESTWSDFYTAMSRIEGNIGIGYFLKPPYIGIDLDDVSEEINRHLQGDEEDNIVSEFINTANSYTEFSPSGTGIHIILEGNLPEGGNRCGKVEMYDKGRYFTVTFNAIGENTVIRDDSDTNVIEGLHKKHILDKRSSRPQQVVTNSEDFEGHNLEDNEVISRALKSRQGERLQELLDGDWEKHYTSQSEADLALVNILAFWTAKDKEQMDHIFRNSGLMRDKWDEKRSDSTYGKNLINKAVNEVSKVYKPNRRPKAKHHLGDNFTEITREDIGGFPVRSADDTGNAERFVDRYGDITRFNYVEKHFYVYNGRVWDADKLDKVELLVDATVDSIEDEDWVVDNALDDEDKKKAQEKADESKKKHISRSRSRHAKTSLRESVKHRIPALPSDFDIDDELLNTPKGFINLTDGSRHASDKDKMFSMMTDALPSENKPTLWLNFLDTIFEGDQEIIEFVQRAMGYTLTGSVKEQAMFILYGRGQNGKSKLIETLRDVLGSYTNNIQAKTLTIRSDDTINNDIAKLQGARMVTSSEPNVGFRFDEGLVKQLTGGDTVTARFLYGEEFNFKPKFKLWLSTNHKPIIKGTDDGIWRRVILIPFNYRIPDSDRDQDFGEKLLVERDEILNWVVEGAIKWNKEGLNIPQSILDVGKQYRKEMDVIEQFVADEADMDESLEERAGDLFQRYKDWAKDTVSPLMSKNDFGSKMKEKFDTKRKSNGIYYIGLKLKKKEYFSYDY